MTTEKKQPAPSRLEIANIIKTDITKILTDAQKQAGNAKRITLYILMTKNSIYVKDVITHANKYGEMSTGYVFDSEAVKELNGQTYFTVRLNTQTNKTSHPHDITLRDSIRTTLSNNILTFLAASQSDKLAPLVHPSHIAPRLSNLTQATTEHADAEAAKILTLLGKKRKVNPTANTASLTVPAAPDTSGQSGLATAAQGHSPRMFQPALPPRPPAEPTPPSSPVLSWTDISFT